MVGEGVSANIMLGPGPSSIATRVMGTGLEVNLRAEALWERGGRADWTEGGRSVGLEGSLIEGSLLDVPSVAFIGTVRFETEAAFLLLS